MDTKDLNRFIKHYLEEDNTHSAILLTAPWGTGKSYYIKNQLIPSIDTDEQRKCIVVSLYGLKDLQEISKSIYLEVRAKVLTKKSEKLSASKIIGKTVIKGVASFFGVNLDISADDLNDLYNSIDLTGKLLVLEDLERCPINIIEILGYVNNLVEQDGAKVLLVANEQEILKYEDKEVIDENSKDKGKQIIKVLTQESKRYLEVKEKTISDTIFFDGQTESAIKEILINFNNPLFNELLQHFNNWGKSIIVEEVYKEIMHHKDINCTNLRAFIYACQKSADIFNSVENDLNLGFARRTFLSIVAFSLKKKQSDNILWDSKSNYSDKLGTLLYPLLRYCYLNIIFQYNYPQELKDAEQNFIEQQKINKELEQNNADIETIYNYYIKTDKEVIESIKHILRLLKNTKTIHPTQYGKLANYLIAIKDVLGCNDEIEECKRLMLENIPTVKSDELADRISFHDSMQLEGNALVEFQNFKKAMLDAVNQSHLNSFDFDYSVENLQNFCEHIYANRDTFISHRVFARKIDNDKLIVLLQKCTAYQIREIYGLYSSVYSFSNIKEYFMEDKDTLNDLRQKISSLVDSSNVFDKIQIMQLNWFIYNLDEILNKLQ
ncbi:MAG: KAP family NTPase [Roseburia sp.]|nr:KAP family NTPase [Roseburia sp.]